MASEIWINQSDSYSNFALVIAIGAVQSLARTVL